MHATPLQILMIEDDETYSALVQRSTEFIIFLPPRPL